MGKRTRILKSKEFSENIFSETKYLLGTNKYIIMALQSITKLFIGGTEIPTFQFLTLSQELASHHELEIVCRMDVLEDLSAALAEESKKFLGETLTLKIGSFDDYDGYGELEFKGIVTGVKNAKGFGQRNGDKVIIKASSPTFLSDDGPHNASYLDKSLSDIINTTFQEYDQSKLELTVQPATDSSLHYSVQQQESCFGYATRLAAQYGEWFYYDGKKLIFGKPDTEELSLKYNFDLKEYNINLMPKSNNYKFYTNDYLLDEIHEKDAKEVSISANGFNAFVSNKSKDIFSKETKIWNNLFNDPKSKQRLESGVEAQKKAIAIQEVVLTGISDNPGIRLGSIVKIPEGSFRVTQITHTNNENGDYVNEFEAITSEIEAYPFTNITATPQSEMQTAVVKENSDPDGMGRLKVQFPWQQDLGETTPWIRVMAPHAGGDKGFHFMPEVGEEVIIGFEGGNAERPFVMGSLYNKSAGSGSFSNSNNDLKAIKTRSGSKIEFDDKDGNETITIVDKNGNSLVIDSKNDGITITSLKNITLNAGENIELNAGKDIMITATQNGNITAGQELSGSAGTKLELTGGATADMTSPKTTVAGEAMVTVSSKLVDINGEAITNVKGGMVNLN
ncbi:hypothetical protein ULVI_09125 [Cochleicola gelatinilyticus]|uniref:Gp5/Type VI secretion system Vgr protein OB-fold domain-containing protein n=2 Tax=Cochleicola gelatinilyticus TaxID=1763537 RepID=A0A167HLB4_9FLAO|nr:hypothetical protein ULVI_09125 [Cochleicola gelatinilyticus]